MLLLGVCLVEAVIFMMTKHLIPTNLQETGPNQECLIKEQKTPNKNFSSFGAKFWTRLSTFIHCGLIFQY